MGVGFKINLRKVSLSKLIMGQLATFFSDSGNKNPDETARLMLHTLDPVDVLEQIKKATKPNRVKFVAVMDNRTTAVCGGLSGRTWPIDSKLVRTPPLHWNCRSALAYYRGKR